MPPCLVHWFFKFWYHHIQTHMWVWSSIPQKGIPNIMGYKNITYIYIYVHTVCSRGIYIYINLYIYISMSIYIYISMSIYIYISMSIYIYINVYIYIYIFENGLMTIPQYIGNPSRLLELLGDDPSIGNQLQRQFGHLGSLVVGCWKLTKIL